MYRFKVRGDEHIPTAGAAILVCNHVSFVDAVLLMAASPRPIYFVMDHRIFDVPVLGWLFRLAKAIPIAPRREDPQAYEAAFDAAAKVLREGDLLAIFPEGAITRDGQLQEFKGGIMKILEREPVPVIPMALTNLWGSFFSRIEREIGAATPLSLLFEAPTIEELAQRIRERQRARTPSIRPRPPGSRARGRRHPRPKVFH